MGTVPLFTVQSNRLSTNASDYMASRESMNKNTATRKVNFAEFDVLLRLLSGVTDENIEGPRSEYESTVKPGPT
jgi:hypothetical protein